MEKSEKIVLSVEEAAQTLGVSRSVVYNLVNSEGFPSLRVGGRRLISRKGLEAWVEARAGKEVI